MAQNRSAMKTQPQDVVVVSNQHQYVVEQLQARKGTWPAIAEKSGVKRNTLAKIADGRIKDPGYSKVLKIATALASS
jgi:transcriptional regulator with XRE-family HTH domain